MRPVVPRIPLACHAWLVVFLALASAPLPCAALPPPAPDQLSVGSISVDQTNLLVTARIPPGLDQVILEMRLSADASWQAAAPMQVSLDGGEITFVIPRPADAAALFRLRGIRSTDDTPLLSSELQYVLVPSLGSRLSGTGDAVFHFKGFVDGSDQIRITRQGALWRHVNWDWPQEAVWVNGVDWNPREKNYLTSSGDTPFLPDQFSLESVRLEVIEGRDVVALERGADGLTVYLNDTLAGADAYEFKIHFQPVASEPVRPLAGSVGRLKIAAVIDGSDRLKLTTTEATWEHKTWSWPATVRLNDVLWNPQEAPVLRNEGTQMFLPIGTDLSSARIVERKGRDLATLWAEKDALWISFADNPNGDDAYELEIRFGD